jgi:hypothetical protein
MKIIVESPGPESDEIYKCIGRTVSSDVARVWPEMPKGFELDFICKELKEGDEDIIIVHYAFSTPSDGKIELRFLRVVTNSIIGLGRSYHLRLHQNLDFEPVPA